MTTLSSPIVRSRRARLSLGTGLAAVATAALLTACSSGSTASTASAASQNGSASGTTISTGQVSGAGTVLTDKAGMTVYEAQQEAGGKILCTGSCLSFWFPVTVTKGTTPSAASSVTGKLGTITRPDGGGTQLTINDHPLYTFKEDTSPGSDKGNDYSDHFGSQSFTWHALTVAGVAAPTGTSSSTPASSSTGSSYGGGY